MQSSGEFDYIMRVVIRVFIQQWMKTRDQLIDRVDSKAKWLCFCGSCHVQSKCLLEPSNLSKDKINSMVGHPVLRDEINSNNAALRFTRPFARSKTFFWKFLNFGTYPFSSPFWFFCPFSYFTIVSEPHVGSTKLMFDLTRCAAAPAFWARELVTRPWVIPHETKIGCHWCLYGTATRPTLEGTCF